MEALGALLISKGLVCIVFDFLVLTIIYTFFIRKEKIKILENRIKTFEKDIILAEENIMLKGKLLLKEYLKRSEYYNHQSEQMDKIEKIFTEKLTNLEKFFNERLKNIK